MLLCDKTFGQVRWSPRRVTNDPGGVRAAGER
jgi:hypothetical protein